MRLTLLLSLFATTALADVHLPAETTVIARFVDGERAIIACGIFAYIGTYVYEVETVEKGPSTPRRIVVDVLCPDFYLDGGKLRFRPGERHRLELDRPQREYAGTTAPPSPLPSAPRFHATAVKNAAAPPALPAPPPGLVLRATRSVVPIGGPIRHELGQVTVDGDCPAPTCRRVSRDTLARLYALARAAAGARHRPDAASPHYGARGISARLSPDQLLFEIADSWSAPLEESDAPAFQAAWSAIAAAAADPPAAPKK